MWSGNCLIYWISSIILASHTAFGTEFTFDLADSVEQCFYEVIKEGVECTLDYQVGVLIQSYSLHSSVWCCGFRNKLKSEEWFAKKVEYFFSFFHCLFVRERTKVIASAVIIFIGMNSNKFLQTSIYYTRSTFIYLAKLFRSIYLILQAHLFYFYKHTQTYMHTHIGRLLLLSWNENIFSVHLRHWSVCKH